MLALKVDDAVSRGLNVYVSIMQSVRNDVWRRIRMGVRSSS